MKAIVKKKKRERLDRTIVNKKNRRQKKGDSDFFVETFKLKKNIKWP